MMRPVFHGHQSADAVPQATMDQDSMFGTGTLHEQKPQLLRSKSAAVTATNPGMIARAASGPALRSENNRLQARPEGSKVVVKAANMAPAQVGAPGQGMFGAEPDEEQPLPDRGLGIVALLGAGVLALWMLR